MLDVTLPRLTYAPGDAFGGKVKEIWLEVGFGGGEHSLAQAAANPHAGLIACEVFEQGLCSMLAALVPQGGEADAPLPPNLRIWPGDARLLLHDLQPASLDRLFLLFPDPWPKARHAKRRFVHPQTADLVASRLKPGAEWRIATDDPTYQAWVEEIMKPHPAFSAQPALVRSPEGWPATRYETKAISASRTPRYWRFVKNAS